MCLEYYVIIGNYMKCWYILYHHERRFPSVMKALFREKVEYYMPVKECYAPRSDRRGFRSTAPKALFPCYMFVFFDPEAIHTSKISAIDGAIGFVRFGGYPCKVPTGIFVELKLWCPEMLTTYDGTIELRNPPDVLSENIHRLSFLPENKLKSRINEISKIHDGSLRLTALLKLIDEADEHQDLQA